MQALPQKYNSINCFNPAITIFWVWAVFEQFGGLALGNQGSLQLANGFQSFVQFQWLHINLLDTHFGQLLFVIAL